MIDEATEIRPKKERAVGATTAGAGSGTLIIVMAKNLTTDPFWESVLLYSAPSIAVFLSFFWLWARVKIANYAQDREIQSVAKKCTQMLEVAAKNPNTSPEHKRWIQKKTEELERFTANSHFNKIKTKKQISTMDLLKMERGFDTQTDDKDGLNK